MDPFSGIRPEARRLAVDVMGGKISLDEAIKQYDDLARSVHAATPEPDPEPVTPFPGGGHCVACRRYRKIHARKKCQGCYKVELYGKGGWRKAGGAR